MGLPLPSPNSQVPKFTANFLEITTQILEITAQILEITAQILELTAQVHENYYTDYSGRDLCVVIFVARAPHCARQRPWTGLPLPSPSSQARNFDTQKESD
jgi:hypothetical protein